MLYHPHSSVRDATLRKGHNATSNSFSIICKSELSSINISECTRCVKSSQTQKKMKQFLHRETDLDQIFKIERLSCCLVQYVTNFSNDSLYKMKHTIVCLQI